MITPDSELDSLVKKYEQDVKNIKHQIYKISWYMRGGVSANDLFYNSDLDDLEILSDIVKENIETSKQTKMPLI